MKKSIMLKVCFCLSTLLFLLACQTENTKEQESFVSGTMYDKDAVLFSLSFLSNINEGRYGSVTDLQKAANTGVNRVLSNDSIIDLVGTWTPVWGPVTYTKNTDANDSCVSDNTMMLLRGFDPENPIDTMYVLSIAGTVSSSAYDWLIEDLDLNYMYPWPKKVNGKPNVAKFGSFLGPTDDSYVTNRGQYISNGLRQGLNVLFNTMKDSSGTTLIDFMEGSFGSSQEALEIAVTGHSLGGALSPCVALSLSDNQSYWNPSGSYNITCYPTAGFSPGNPLFAQYFAQELGNDFHGSSNSLDVAINVYETSTLLNVSNLYDTLLSECAPLQNQEFMKELLNCFSERISRFNYTSLYPDSTAFTSIVPISCTDLDTMYSMLRHSYDSLNTAESDIISHFNKAASKFGLIPSDSLYAATGCFGAMAIQQHVNAYIGHFGVELFDAIYSEQLAPPKAIPKAVEHYFIDELYWNRYSVLEQCLDLH